MTNLSEHFTIEEMIYSDTANIYKINNMPSLIHKKTLTHTCQYFLEPLRKLLNEYYGKAIIKITSGYRCQKLNTKIGSKSTSQHTTGEACDIQVYKYTKNIKIAVPYNELYSLIKQWVKEDKLSVDQCIQESSNGAYWVHCSYKAGGSTVNRNQFLKYDGKTYKLDN